MSKATGKRAPAVVALLGLVGALSVGLAQQGLAQTPTPAAPTPTPTPTPKAPCHLAPHPQADHYQ
jgi:hypothetical protein